MSTFLAASRRIPPLMKSLMKKTTKTKMAGLARVMGMKKTTGSAKMTGPTGTMITQGWNSRVLAAAIAPLLLLTAACASAPHERRAENREAVQYFKLGQADFSEGKNQQAIENLKRSLKLDSKNADVHNFLGVVYLLLSDFPSAEKELEDALKLNPYLTDAKNSLGAVYMKTERPGKAREIFEEALNDKTYPDPEKILYNLGTLDLEAKRYPEALDAFQRAVVANAAYAKGYFGLARVYAETGRTQDARTNYQKVISLDPKSPEAARAQEFLARKPVPGRG
jgi:type IV pilus biogenesis/stability protein PilW